MHTQLSLYKYIFSCALLAAIILFGMFVTSIVYNGLDQQQFELVYSAQEYTSDIIENMSGLKIIFTLDNVFIVLYITVFLFLGLALKTEKNLLLVYIIIIGMLVVGVLDFYENHRIMMFLTSATQGFTISLNDIQDQMVWSQLKFHISYLILFLVAFLLPETTVPERMLRWSLWFLQLPIGVLVYTSSADFSYFFNQLRFFLFFFGFLLLAWNFFIQHQKLILLEQGTN